MADTPNMSWPQQSPIDISETHNSDELVAPAFHYPAMLSGRFDVSDPHHPNFVVSPACNAYIRFEGMDCPLAKVHFHQPSEHKVMGTQFAFEAHLVHKIPMFPDTWPSVYVVVGVFFDFPKRPKAARSAAAKRDSAAAIKALPFKPKSNMAKTLAALQFVPAASGEFDIDPKYLLPPEKLRSEHYRYEGSLTSPAYAELVDWVVLKHHAVLDEDPEIEIEAESEQEARECQPLNRRFVLRSFR